MDYARLPKEPVSPNNVRNAVIGALAGFVVAVLLVVMQVLLDVRVKGEEDLKRICQAPVLGTIPDFAETDHGSYSKYGYGYGYGSKKPQSGKEEK